MSEPFHQTDISFLTIKDWTEKVPGLQVGISTRQGGCSEPPFDTLNLGLHVSDENEKIVENRRRLAKKLNIELENWVCGEQIHQTNIAIVTSKDKAKGVTEVENAIAGCDGFILKEPGILCTAFFADCVPLYFFDPKTGWLGIAHAGWKGTVGRMAEKMVRKLEAMGVNIHTLLVVIGPCIGTSFYEVDERVISKIPEEYREKVVYPTDNKHGLLDLKKLNHEILIQAGVPYENISVTKYCTFGDEKLFYSHRRDHGRSGRMLGFIGYK